MTLMHVAAAIDTCSSVNDDIPVLHTNLYSHYYELHKLNSYSLIIIFFVLLPCGLLSAALAVSKKQQFWIWLIAGLVFGPIGLIGSSYVKDKSLPPNAC